MSEHDPPQRGAAKSEADETLLGVAPPRIDSSGEPLKRSPVFVRSGTASADVEPPPLTQPAPPSPSPGSSSAASGAPPAMKPSALAEARARLEPSLRYTRAHPVLGMVVIPVLLSLGLVAWARHGGRHGLPVAAANSGSAAEPGIAAPATPIEPSKADTLAELERRPASSLSSRELVLLAEGHAEQKRAQARALFEKIQQNPASGNDSALQSQLLQLAADPATAADALSAMALLEPPFGSDLLYEVWTGTSVRTDTTELARALLYSTDVRSKASPALAVTLDLRAAETCQQFQAILPKALTDGDRRALHPLTKLSSKRGCGPKKSEDCFACLRGDRDELVATVNAVKSRRAPSFTAL